ncbi:hypothetical protein BDR03DRAFT_1016279 [Suillus americanus]|nr:hypothetical protein BDR03DRAFT_1016279 [Suillus americanus]
MLPQSESPRRFFEQECYDEAAQTLAYVDFIGEQRLPLFAQFRMMGYSRQIVLRWLIPSITTFQRWTGVDSANYFSPQIFAALGITSTASGLSSTVFYVVA